STAHRNPDLGAALRADDLLPGVLGGDRVLLPAVIAGEAQRRSDRSGRGGRRRRHAHPLAALLARDLPPGILLVNGVGLPAAGTLHRETHRRAPRYSPRPTLPLSPRFVTIPRTRHNTSPQKCPQGSRQVIMADAHRGRSLHHPGQSPLDWHLPAVPLGL